jgi:hypothetical protein
MLSLPIAFSSAIGVFAPVFSRPVWQHVKVLLTGAVLAPGQRTVTAILRIMGLRVSPKSLLCHIPVAERPIDIGGFEALEHQVYSTDP